MTTNTTTQLKNVSDTKADDNHEIILRAQIAKSRGTEFFVKDFLDELQLQSLTIEHKKQLAELCDISLSKVNNALLQHEAEKKMIVLLGKVPSNAYEFVDLQLQKWNTQMTYQGIYTIDTPYEVLFPGTTDKQIFDAKSFSQLSESEQLAIKAADPKRLTFDGVFKKLQYSNVSLDTKYSERSIELGLEGWSEKAKNQIVADMITNITGTIVDAMVAEEEWSKFIEATTTDNLEETKAVLKHFIWQVKRKIIDDNCYPVTNHLMPVLYGDQGAGKSTWMKLFTQPVSDFTASTDFKAITDERNHEIWSKYVLIFDEMADSARSNIEDIKRKITEISFSGRKMKTNSATQIFNKSTFMGASNKDISRLIIDDTGMRRFFQINYKKPTGNEWSVLSNIDYSLLWNSIDYKNQSPLHASAALFESIQNIQNSKRHVGCVEQFLMDRKYSKTTEYISGAQLYEEFKAYELTQKTRNEQSNTAFVKELMDIYKRISGLDISKTRKKSGLEYTITYTSEGYI